MSDVTDQIFKNWVIGDDFHKEIEGVFRKELRENVRILLNGTWDVEHHTRIGRSLDKDPAFDPYRLNVDVTAGDEVFVLHTFDLRDVARFPIECVEEDEVPGQSPDDHPIAHNILKYADALEAEASRIRQRVRAVYDRP